jgi:hypothetical protein
MTFGEVHENVKRQVHFDHSAITQRSLDGQIAVTSALNRLDSAREFRRGNESMRVR